MSGLSSQALRAVILRALREDTALRDATSRALLGPEARIRARIVAREAGVAAGIQVAAMAFTLLDPALRCRRHLRSGNTLSPGSIILTVEGRVRSIFAVERTALNFLGHLSGVATLTRRFVKQVSGTRARIFDTRKTLPGLRALEKCAVAAGGGFNHRADLSQAVLIKTNHLRTLRQPIEEIVRRARRRAGGKFIEIEVTNLRELAAALTARPDAILLDNWPLAAIRQAVRMRGRRRLLLEVSGGVTLENARAIAKTGVDRISVGCLTHSAPSLDLSLKVL